MTKRVLVTGGAGFIAHHLIAKILRTTDWEIVSLDRLDYSGNLNRLNDIMQEFDPETRKRVRIVYHDLKAALNPLICSEIGDVDYILHLAAGSHVDRSIENSDEFITTNINGTHTLLKLLHEFPIKKYIQISTDEVYGSLKETEERFTENTPLAPSSPYAASKTSADLLCRSFHKTYNNDTKVRTIFFIYNVVF